MTPQTIQLTEPLKFLVVDDSRAIQAIVRRAILNCGYSPIDVRLALNGEAALDMVEDYLPDLIITDWHMPKVSGLEMLQALRQMGHKHVRVGFVTTEKTPAMLEEASANGAMFIINKPFDDVELATTVVACVKDLAKPMMQEPVVLERPRLEPVSEAEIKKTLAYYLGNIPFRLVPNDQMSVSKLTPNNLLGLYVASGRKGVYAIGVMDANAVCVVGGGAGRKPPPEVRAAMAGGQPTDDMLKRANEFLGALADGLTQSVPEHDTTVTISKTSMVKSTFAKLAEVLNQDGNRSDFRVSIPGYGEGRMAWFVMA